MGFERHTPICGHCYYFFILIHNCYTYANKWEIIKLRIIEPQNLNRTSIRPKKQASLRLPLVVLLLIIVVGIFWLKIRPQKIDNFSANSGTSNPKTTKTTQQTVETKNKLKTFNNQQFVEFYSSFAYPNTSEIVSPPKITNNPAADKIIQNLAEKRGYKLRSAPITLPVLFEDGNYVQQKALTPLTDMFAAAKKAGLSLVVTAAFRSVDTQRELFLSRLNANPDQIAAGLADDAVNETLKVTAPPGYSRHHNGFTIDLACGSVGGLAFLNTGCYSWLSKNNFENAKNFGWIPSYPNGASSSGPEPEPWEYVWVGKDSLLE